MAKSDRRQVEFDEIEVEDRLGVVVRDRAGQALSLVSELKSVVTPLERMRQTTALASVGGAKNPLDRARMADEVYDLENRSKVFNAAVMQYKMERSMKVAGFIERIEDEFFLDMARFANADIYHFLAAMKTFHGEQAETLKFVQAMTTSRNPYEPPVIQDARALHVHLSNDPTKSAIEELPADSREKVRNIADALKKMVLNGDFVSVEATIVEQHGDANESIDAV
tara:strand:- start:1229 stop:1903 length:675 start_codon:yes stop_codon:yes gene_type:complete